MFDEECVIIRVALVDGDGHMLPAGKIPLIGMPDHRENLGLGQGRRHDHADLFPVIGAEIGREDAVHLALSQRLKRRGGRGVADRFEIQMGVGHAVGGIGQIVLHQAGQFARVFVLGAEGQIVVLIAHADGPMLCQPVDLFRSEKGVGADAPDVFFKELLVVIAVFVLNPAHGRVQLVQQIRAVFADREIVIGRACLADRDRLGRMDEGIHRDVAVKLTHGELFQRLFLRVRNLDDLRLHAVLFCPFPVLIRLYAALVDADPPAVLRARILRQNLAVVRRDEEIVFLRAHGQRGIEHVFGALLGVRDIAHEIDFALLQHLEQVRPASADVLIGPARIAGQLDLVFIGIAAAPAALVQRVVGRVVPADPDDLPVLLCLRRSRHKKDRRKNKAQQKGCCASEGNDLRLLHLRILTASQAYGISA